MKVNKEFLVAYDRIFSWVLKHHGLDSLIDMWKYIAPVVAGDLAAMAKRDGIKGCFTYWSNVLSAEGCQFRIDFDPTKEVMKLEITGCSSIQKLNTPECTEYCRHCGIIYAEVLEPLGLKYEWKHVGGGRCEIKVSKPLREE